MTNAEIAKVGRQASDVQYHTIKGQKNRMMIGMAIVRAKAAAVIYWQRGPYSVITGKASGYQAARIKGASVSLAASIAAPAAANVVTPRLLRRAIGVAALGSPVEWFDFGVYNYIAVTLGTVFFPTEDPAAQSVSALLTFAIAFPSGQWRPPSDRPGQAGAGLLRDGQIGERAARGLVPTGDRLIGTAGVATADRRRAAWRCHKSFTDRLVV
jgi:hypothetical protein